MLVGIQDVLSSAPMAHNVKTLRRQILSQRYPLDPQLTAWCAGHTTHAYLANPSAQAVVQYLTRFVAEALKARKPNQSPGELRFLDWGAGKGQVTYFLRKHGLDPVACDFQSAKGDSALEGDRPILAKAKIDVLPLTNAVKLPFADASFDAVTSFGVLEHVQNDQASLKKIARVLAPGGLFFCFLLPYKLSWFEHWLRLQGGTYHEGFYSERWVRLAAKAAGLHVIDLWHRALFPKNALEYRRPHLAERLDQFLCAYTPLRYLAANLEFVAQR